MELPSPFSMIVVGPSGSGKTHWVKKLLDSNLIQPQPQNIHYCYGEYQPLFNEMKNVTFHEGVPPNLYESFKPSVRNMIIIDDLMENPNAQNMLVQIFTKGSHHRCLTAIVLLQVLFPRNPKFRTISLNTNYIVLFKSARDRQQIKTLAKQMSLNRVLPQAWEDSVNLSQFGYLLIDLRGSCDEGLRLRTRIFPQDGHTIVYQRK